MKKASQGPRARKTASYSLHPQAAVHLHGILRPYSKPKINRLHRAHGMSHAAMDGITHNVESDAHTLDDPQQTSDGQAENDSDNLNIPTAPPAGMKDESMSNQRQL
ncbi:hypothetical protein NDU88_009094 [Pleurodeles waltl]|uniref:Uncharacterized protein n=1 Tax=Pleurodeles waltl TaxID=8319 RepID=A0AAV7RV69_PLEWA|nr:hypothetical protein NDU88_009094 [Pleurodeles waltl]